MITSSSNAQVKNIIALNKKSKRTPGAEDVFRGRRAGKNVSRKRRGNG